MAKVLNAMISKELKERQIQGMSLPFERKQQIVTQYVDDTSFTLYGKKKVGKLVYLLETFCLAIGLVLNWSKSSMN